MRRMRTLVWAKRCSKTRVYRAMKQIENRIQRSETVSPGKRSIVLLGFSRNGKTLIAKGVASRLAYQVISLDEIRRILDTFEGSATAFPCRSYIITTFFRKHREGILMEGDDLFGENTKKLVIERREQFGDAVRKLLELGVIVVFVGSADANATQKAGAIKKYGSTNVCWAAEKYNITELEDLAKRNIAFSADLKMLALDIGVPYFGIRSDTFEGDIATVIEFLETKALE